MLQFGKNKVTISLYVLEIHCYVGINPQRTIPAFHYYSKLSHQRYHLTSVLENVTSTKNADTVVPVDVCLFGILNIRRGDSLLNLEFLTKAKVTYLELGGEG
jgi:hypothetical protein